MAMQEIWSGTVSFSLVATPVKLVKALGPGHVSFHMLHTKDYSPLARKMYCPKEASIVAADEIVRGYEVGPDTYIIVTDEELESLTPERSSTIEIIEFIGIKEVGAAYYDHPYYLLPLKGGEKAYQLLVEVMRRTNKAGLAKFVLREREYLVAVKSTDGVLALITLHYSDEILPDDDIVPKEREVDAEEESRVKKAIRKMTADFNPSKYADKRRKRIIDLLEKKAKEQTLVESPEIEEEEGEGPPDLIAVLEESMRRVRRDER